MDWLFPSIVATLLGSIVLAVTYYVLYRSDQRTFLRYYTYAWCLYTLRFLFMLCYEGWSDKHILLLMGSQLATLWSGVLLLMGTNAFLERKASLRWAYLAILISLYIVLTGGYAPSIMALSLPVFFLLGGLFIWIGIIFFRQQVLRGTYATVLGILFVVWGVHKADYPFLRPVEALAPWGYMLGAVLEIAVALGILMLYFQHAQSQITESKEKYRMIVENQNDLIVKYDADRRIIYASPSFCKATGRTEKELLGKGLIQHANPDDLEELTTALAELEHPPHIARYTESVRTVRGRRWFSWSAKALMDESGRIGEILSVGRDITEQKQAERALAESELKWRHVLINTPQIGIILDRQTRIRFVNRQFRKLTGWESQDLMGKNWLDLFEPNHRMEIKNNFEDLVFQGSFDKYAVFENEILTRDGELKNISWSIVVNTDANGNVADITCLGVDLTERKRTEKALRDSEAYMQSVFRAAPVGIGVVIDRVFKIVNDKFCRMLGYSARELLEQNAEMIYPSKSAYETVGKIKYDQIAETGTGTVETAMKTKDGKIISVLLSSTPIDARHHELGITFTALDVTNIKKAQEAVRQSEIKYRTMMEAIKDPVYICSQDHRIEYMNPAMINRTGFDATGELCHEVLHGLGEKCPWCRHQEINGPTHSDIDIVSPKDNRSYNVSSTIFENETGSFSKISVLRDNTQIKRLQDRLQQAQKMEAIGNLAGGIAHDFNNILFPIVGLAELLLEDLPQDSMEYQNVQEIHYAGRRGSDLVNQILAFSRQTELKMIPVWIQKVLKEVLKLSRTTIPSDITISQDIDEKCGKILIDPTQLHQVALNLITNAYHAVEPSGGKIHVSLSETDHSAENGEADSAPAPGRYAKLTVTDTGCGITPENMEKIFEPYFTTKDQGKGTGLGLSVVYGIVKEYKGDITVSSAVGKGTTFDVFFPLLETDGDRDHTNDTIPVAGGNETILLVDDEAAVIRLEKEILERLGYATVVRTSSVEALEAFKADPAAFDLVMTDMTMPNLTGLQLAREMMRIRPDIPILICTGFSERLDMNLVNSMGIKGMLMKPIVKSDLARMIREALDPAPLPDSSLITGGQ